MDDLKSEPKIERAPETGAPRWVKAFGYVALVIAVLMVLHLFFGGGAALHG